MTFGPEAELCGGRTVEGAVSERSRLTKLLLQGRTCCACGPRKVMYNAAGIRYDGKTPAQAPSAEHECHRLVMMLPSPCGY